MYTQIKSLKKDRRGVSPMIAYIMLVSFVIVLGILVYNWMKTYVPQEDLSCPDGASLFVEDYVCNPGSLNLTIRNNGRFSVGGYFIYATNNPDQELASVDLSEYSTAESPFLSQTGGVQLGSVIGENSFSPEDATISSFDFSSATFSTIYSIEIVPIRWEEQGRRRELVSCTDSKIEEVLNCS